MEVEGWRQIGHITNGIHINATIVLYEIRVLGLNEESDIVIVFLDLMTEGETQVVGIVLVF